ncbi:hypothetical protein GCM10009557_68110 [Virgisporangium ochraceum]
MTQIAVHLVVDDPEVADVDAVWDRATAAGATAFEPPHDAFRGDLTAQVLDPYETRWAVNRHLRDVSAEELAAHVADSFA